MRSPEELIEVFKSYKGAEPLIQSFDYAITQRRRRAIPRIERMVVEDGYSRRLHLFGHLAGKGDFLSMGRRMGLAFLTPSSSPDSLIMEIAQFDHDDGMALMSGDRDSRLPIPVHNTFLRLSTGWEDTVVSGFTPTHMEDHFWRIEFPQPLEASLNQAAYLIGVAQFYSTGSRRYSRATHSLTDHLRGEKIPVRQ